tara:strand:- start:672 stop:1235 length:564 start_codon:yes stop_codon:yes gene_type:complete
MIKNTISAIIYVFSYLIITDIVNGETLIISNGKLGLEIKYGEELTVKYKTRNGIESHTGDFFGVFKDSIILDNSSAFNQNFSELNIDIGRVISLKTKVAPSGSLSRRIENYTRIFGLSSGVASAGYVMVASDWDIFGIIVAPIIGTISAFGGGSFGVIFAILSHYNEFSKPKEYKLQNDNWRIIVNQ